MELTSAPAIDVIEVEQSPESTLRSEEFIGHIFNSCEGNQLAHWICLKDIISEEHTHEFDEYFAVMQGQYLLYLNGKEICLGAGNDVFIPAGTPHSGKMHAGTSILHVFGGHRPPLLP